ncbi:MAG: T9SS type A sorting domain-containing protein [bacterium]
MVLAVLRQLVNVVHVAQGDIYIGDPMKHIYKHCYDLWHAEFPNVHYLDNTYSTLGREKVTASTSAKIYYSDHGSVLRANVWDPSRPGTGPVYNDNLYSVLEDAEYMINIPMLKGHKRAGTTMFAKNHFGTHTRNDASHLHNGLIAPMEMEKGITRPGYGLYRVQVDLMMHSMLGKKNLLYLMDALWSTDYELDIPLKWKMSPFNNDWSSSLFVSFDNVAIESVGYDFLRSEYTIARGAGTYVQMEGVDDYLHQAADSSYWPKGIKYDPDSIGVYVYSLGVHEHWNTATEKRYSKNLGTGTGIELIALGQGASTGMPTYENRPAEYFILSQNYPNPFNPQTMIKFSVPVASFVTLRVYNMMGQEIVTLVQGEVPAGEHQIQWTAKNLPTGMYFYTMDAGNISETKKLIYLK